MLWNFTHKINKWDKKKKKKKKNISMVHDFVDGFVYSRFKTACTSAMRTTGVRRKNSQKLKTAETKKWDQIIPILLCVRFVPTVLLHCSDEKQQKLKSLAPGLLCNAPLAFKDESCTRQINKPKQVLVINMRHQRSSYRNVAKAVYKNKTILNSRTHLI